MKTFAAYLEIVAIAFFFLMMVFGAHAGMAMQEGKMTNCPFLGGFSSICQMNILSHIEAWQIAFSSPIPKITGLLIGLFFVLFLSGLSFKERAKIRSIKLLFYRDKLVSRFSNYLVFLLSRGILNPKIFSSHFAF